MEHPTSPEESLLPVDNEANILLRSLKILMLINLCRKWQHICGLGNGHVIKSC